VKEKKNRYVSNANNKTKTLWQIMKKLENYHEIIKIEPNFLSSKINLEDFVELFNFSFVEILEKVIEKNW
jgi:hypothetical protein